MHIYVKLISWSNHHAVVLLLACSLLLIGFPLLTLALAAAISFALFIVSYRRNWTATAQFGWANYVTLLRLMLVHMLILYGESPPIQVILISIMIFSLDGLDGWLARHFHQCTEFGEYFDKETDAFFVLVLCWLVYLDQRLSGWILIAGLLRYFFVIFLMLAKPPNYKEQQTKLGKYSFAVTVIVLIFCFTPYYKVYTPLAIAITGLLCYSFADTLVRIYKK